jgi:hypothetical protein
MVQAISIEHDFKAWYDVMRRLNHMFEMEIDLDELEEQSYELMVSMDAKIDEVDEQMPELNVRAYMEEVTQEFDAPTFVPPLSDVWGKALGNLLQGDQNLDEDDLDDEAL